MSACVWVKCLRWQEEQLVCSRRLHRESFCQDQRPKQQRPRHKWPHIWWYWALPQVLGQACEPSSGESHLCYHRFEFAERDATVEWTSSQPTVEDGEELCSFHFLQPHCFSLAKNGYVSSSKRTKHIKAKYFFIRHYHHAQELDLQYCPTEQMWADVLTKPLQGSKFRQMRAFLMNCPIDYAEDIQFLPSDNPSLNPTHSSTPKSSVPYPSPSPSLPPSLLPMKPRISSITPSSPGCVETPIQLTSSNKPVLGIPPSVTQKVTWKDALFPPVIPLRVQPIWA